jgi:hypothetical protein
VIHIHSTDSEVYESGGNGIGVNESVVSKQRGSDYITDIIEERILPKRCFINFVFLIIRNVRCQHRLAAWDSLRKYIHYYFKGLEAGRQRSHFPPIC